MYDNSVENGWGLRHQGMQGIILLLPGLRASEKEQTQGYRGGVQSSGLMDWVIMYVLYRLKYLIT